MYRRLVFKTHVIYIAGVGGLIARTVGYSRSDREMGVTRLLEERRKVQTQYAHERDARVRRLEELGVGAGTFRTLAPDRPRWMLDLSAAWLAAGRRGDPYESLGARAAAVRNEIDMWTIERDALMRRVASLSVEIHKKYSLPAACIVFVLVGAPIGMRVRRAGPAVAFVSIAFFLFYYLCLVGGEELANRLLLPPWLSMWLANIVIGFWGLKWTLEACEFRAPRRRALAGTPGAA
jgi:lipopolysaccharide export system permease protein